jgi:hypothetical protein
VAAMHTLASRFTLISRCSLAAAALATEALTAAGTTKADAVTLPDARICAGKGVFGGALAIEFEVVFSIWISELKPMWRCIQG